MIENQGPKQLDEVHSSPTTDKNQSERHSQIQQIEEDQLNYDIDEVFEAFTFNLSKNEVSWKRIRNDRQDDGTYKEVQEDEILFERTEEDPVTVATASVALTQATANNINVLNEKFFIKLKLIIISLKKRLLISKLRYIKGER